MRMSAPGLQRLVTEEPLRLTPYNDAAGHATIGIGHRIHFGPVTQADVNRFAGFTAKGAVALLTQDVQSRERFVGDAVTVALGQNEFDALVSLVVDIGSGAFSTSTVLRRLNAGARQAAADAFLLFVAGGAGPANRRRRERELFLTPDTPHAHAHVFLAPSAR